MKIAKEFVCREIAGEYILVPVGKTAQEFSGMINLNATAHFVWEWLDKVSCRDELLEKMLENFEIDEQEAGADVDEFIGQLLENGFIEYTDQMKKW